MLKYDILAENKQSIVLLFLTGQILPKRLIWLACVSVASDLSAAVNKVSN